MKIIGKRLFEPQRHNLFRFSLVAALIAAIGSGVVLFTAYGIAQAIGYAPNPETAPDMPATTLQFFGVVVFAPLVETAILAFTITVLSDRLRSKLWIAVFAALVWGGLHSLVSPFWFFGTVWSFFVFSCSYLMWRPQSLKHALAAAAIPHALLNTVVFISVALSASA